MTTLWTIGYERLLPEELVAELEAERIERLLDVRFRPQSRRAGMSKTRLGERLGDHGIAYEHRRSLGTPPDIRHLFRTKRFPEAWERYTEHVEATASDELDALAAELPRAPRTVLLCLEAEPEGCHRRLVAEALRRRLNELEIVHL